MHKILLRLIFFQSIFFCCSQTSDKNAIQASDKNYDLSVPEQIYKLPEELNEISGIVYIGNEKIACIQDEEGIIFIYDLTRRTIQEQMKFDGSADFEDIVKVNGSYFILKSDGTVYEYTESKTYPYKTFLKNKNNTEGLCYDRKNSVLLISCKRKPYMVYPFKLSDKKLSKEPLFEIKSKNFAPTAMAFDNEGENLFVLSNRQVAVYGRDGKVRGTYDLEPALFRQAEGITFKENGDLLISNEANGGEATILLFKKRNA